jgi:hypothetical protein
MLSVVRMSECRISFCCTAIAVPSASSNDEVSWQWLQSGSVEPSLEQFS